MLILGRLLVNIIEEILELIGSIKILISMIEFKMNLKIIIW